MEIGVEVCYRFALDYNGEQCETAGVESRDQDGTIVAAIPRAVRVDVFPAL